MSQPTACIRCKGIELVELLTPAMGCHTASAVVELAVPGGQHDQRELRLLSDGAFSWKVDSSLILASWRPVQKAPGEK